MPREHIHFVTGRLAEFSLRNVLAGIASEAGASKAGESEAGFDYSVGVLGITVAALMTPDWVARKLVVPAGATRVILPGYCLGDLSPVCAAAAVPVERGPKDLRELPQFFGRAARSGYGHYDIEVLAEINHSPRLAPADILAEAARLRSAGADVIDVGCDPGATWAGAGECVAALVQEGHRVSIDSYDPAEIGPAVRAGAELVLSVNASNRRHAGDWGCEVVIVPDTPGTLDGVDDTIAAVAAAGVPWRLDPILEPIGFGFARSLGRYLEARRRWPEAAMLMGIGNLTELTDADSAAINVLLLGFCQELSIKSVLTTEVINWARSSVAECDLARRLAYYAVRERALPKHVEPRLVMLRDARLLAHGPEALARLAGEIKDHNYRLFAEDGRLHLLSTGMHLEAADAYELFDLLLARQPKNLDAAHAFYLGYELAKAVTALTLGKQYRQDEALDWGLLTVPEKGRHKERNEEEGMRDEG